MKKGPPRLAQRFFSWYCRNQLHESILGDLEEQFYQHQAKYGMRRAKWRYWLEVFRFVNRFTLQRQAAYSSHTFYPHHMIKHNLISSFRFFRNNLGFTLINISGLTIGLGSFILILLFVNHELSFDQFHPDQDRVFRVNFSYQDNKGNATYLVNSPPAMASGIRDQFPELEKSSRLRYAMNCLFSRGDLHFYEDHGYFADSLFLEILPFEMLSGDPNTALDQPNSIVISQKLASKYFDDSDPIGSTILFNNTTPLEVTGVLADLPSNSHLNFDYLISFANYIVPEGYASDLSSWSWLGFLTYVKLAPGHQPKSFEAHLSQYLQELNPEFENYFSLTVQPLSDIYLGSTHMSDDLASHIRTGNRFNVKALLLVAILILVIAGFNFSNLSNVLSINRSKSTGLRKVLGAHRKGVVVQLLTESFLLTFFCLFLAVGLILLLFPSIAQFMRWEFSIGRPDTGKLLPFLALVGVVLSLASGLYPALRLAKAKVIPSLKGTLDTDGRKPLQLKNVLLTLQFAISIGLICATLVMTKQINFLSNTATGYHSENVVLIKMLPEDLSRFYDIYKERLVQHSSIMEVSRSERVIGESWPFSVIRNLGEDPAFSKRIFFNQVDYDYFSALDIPLLEGRDFSPTIINDPTKAVVINQLAVEHLGLENPIGQQVHFFELDGPRTIVGVVEDFHYTSLHQEIGPAAVMLPFIDLEYMYVRFRPGNTSTQVGLLEDTWKEVAEDIPLDWNFLDTDLATLYQAEQKLSSMIQTFSALAILLACLGLYGMVTFMVKRRIKEVGVRKVLGASLSSLYLLFVRTYLYQTLVAMLLILPLIHYLLGGWLRGFAYHIHISWWVYPLSAVLLIGMILMTVSFQIIQTARVNPTYLLRHE